MPELLVMRRALDRWFGSGRITRGRQGAYPDVILVVQMDGVKWIEQTVKKES
jgi:hypothetical protein